MAVNDPGLVGLTEIGAARHYLEGLIQRTPVTGSTYLGGLIGAELYFKLEMFQKTGSFKPRGVLNKMRSLSEDERRKGVISLSAGNHAQALAYVASMDGVESTIGMPAGAVRSKVEATRGYGGNVIQTEDDLLLVTHRSADLLSDRDDASLDLLARSQTDHPSSDTAYSDWDTALLDLLNTQ